MKKGFTLIELLAVIVILAIIALIAVPVVLNIIDSSKNESDERSIELYAKAIENAVAKSELNGNKIKTGQLSEEFLKTVESEGSRVECEITKLNKDGTVSLDSCKINGKKVNYVYGIYKDNSGAAVPNLMNDTLTPIVYKNNKWVIANPSKDEWYDYNSQEWANAVILKDTAKSKTVGDELTIPTSTSDVDSSDVIAMLVWIPRYSYTIKDKYGIGLFNDTPVQATPGAIDIKFVDTGIKEKGNALYIDEIGDTWYTHPAFTFGSEELSGIWVGKFETTGTGDVPTILPNQASLRSQTISEEFATAQIFNTNLKNYGDSHMTKNSEWGAVAYLSQSKYGKYGNTSYSGINKEVYQNKSNNYVTGNSNGTPGSSNTNKQCRYDDMTTKGEGTGQCGPGASTTGNIYGIYDMSGGAIEYVMGYLTAAYTTDESKGLPWGATSTSNAAGFTEKPDSKYFDEYTSSNATTACNNQVCKGHALSETLRWYTDYAGFISLGSPWLLRGGVYSDTSEVGIFDYYLSSGGANGYRMDSFRIAFAPTT